MRIKVVYDYTLLKKRMSDKGYSQTSLAKKIGMSRTSLNGKLNNKVEFSQDEIKKIAEVLNIENENNQYGAYFFGGVVR